MGTFILKRRSFSQYDDTDRLKQMKDSDILAEKKKKAPGYGSVARTTAGGVVAGATALAAAKGLNGAIKGQGFKGAMAGMGRGIKRGAGKGALIGGAIAAGVALSKRSKEAKATEFYNDRLEYAQRQAGRREKADWKANMTQRQGYSY